MDEIRDKELMLLKEQELSNLVHLKKYGRAIKLALELDFPLKLRTILEELLLGEAPKAKPPYMSSQKKQRYRCEALI